MHRFHIGFLLAVCWALCSLFGCGKGVKYKPTDIERGKLAVEQALESWKNNEPVDKLKTAPDPVEFIEELRLTHTLLEFTITFIDSNDPKVLRYTVQLSMKNNRSQNVEREATYAVQLETPVKVSRDPYF